MPNLKVKKGNDALTFELTDNLRDVGEKRLPIVINGKTYYARLGADKTALVVQRTSNGAKSYVQTSPILFTTWNWQKYPTDIRGTEKMFVYLPKGKYRATVDGQNSEKNEFTITTSTDIEVNVSLGVNTESAQKATFNINGWRNWVYLTRHLLKIKIERIGE
ncbi:hypothetical protein [uncultured Veillonella sp.]|uniref:hypothetical protein n=1 Tax=uncultured Veillonella sp. TaxID=159268 RepID=UPI0026771E94|nr:hypothetical protein [uncultured Veillonella sp.]